MNSSAPCFVFPITDVCSHLVVAWHQCLYWFSSSLLSARCLLKKPDVLWIQGTCCLEQWLQTFRCFWKLWYRALKKAAITKGDRDRVKAKILFLSVFSLPMSTSAESRLCKNSVWPHIKETDSFFLCNSCFASQHVDFCINHAD